MTTPWPRAFSPRWSASSSTGVRSVPRPRRAWRSSNSSRAGTTHAAGTPPWVTSARTTSNAPRRRQRHVRCATLIVRLEASPVLPRAASQREKHTLRGDPIDRSWGRLYVHRLSPTSGLVATAQTRPPKRGKSTNLRATGKLEHIRLGADFFEYAGSAAQMLLKTPNFAKCFSILSATLSAARPVCACNLSRLGRTHFPMGAMMHFSRHKNARGSTDRFTIGPGMDATF